MRRLGLGGGRRGRARRAARLRRAWASTLAVACSTSSTATRPRRSLQLGHRLGLGVAGLDLLLDLVERRHVVADVSFSAPSPSSSPPASSPGRAGDSSFDCLGDLLLQHSAVLLDGGLGLVGGLRRLEHQSPSGSRRPSPPGSAGWRWSRPPSCTAPPSSASPAFCASVGHHERLAGVGVELLELAELGVEAQLALLLVGDHVGRLLLEPDVLGLGLGDRLLELHLRGRRAPRTTR